MTYDTNKISESAFSVGLMTPINYINTETGTTVTIENHNHEEVKIRLNLWNATIRCRKCYLPLSYRKT